MYVDFQRLKRNLQHQVAVYCQRQLPRLAVRTGLAGRPAPARSSRARMRRPRSAEHPSHRRLAGQSSSGFSVTAQTRL